MRIIVLGFGIVGKSFSYLLEARRLEIARDFGMNLKVVGVVDSGGAALCCDGLDYELLVKAKSAGSVAAYPGYGRSGMSAVEVIDAVEADVVVEATPTNIVTGEPGLTHLKTAFRAGRHVITTNKGPLALAFHKLSELALHNEVLFRFSGTVGGGLPVLAFAKKCLRGDRIVGVRGILNGTTNYVLTKMEREGVTAADALREAQNLGIAERDSSLDLDGVDAATKLVIIANWILGRNIVLADVDVVGIREIETDDLARAARRGNAIKLIASSDGKAKVAPVEISKSSPLNVGGICNAVTFVSEFAGEETLTGKGAGGQETASAILRDLIDIKESLVASESHSREAADVVSIGQHQFLKQRDFSHRYRSG